MGMSFIRNGRPEPGLDPSEGPSILGRVVSRDNFTKASPPAELLAARVSSIGGSGRAGSFQENHGKGRSARRHPAIIAMNAPGIGAVTPLYAAELYCLAVSCAHQRHRNLPHRNMLPSVVSTVAATLYQVQERFPRAYLSGALRLLSGDQVPPGIIGDRVPVWDFGEPAPSGAAYLSFCFKSDLHGL